MVVADRKKTLELKKHVGAIHSSNKLSLLQRKIANALLFNAYDDLLEKDEHEIHVATLCRLIGYDSNDHKTIKKALVNLLATVIEWNLVDGNKVDTDGVWNASSIISDASIDGPVCTYSYSNKMKKLLYRPELYGRLNMVVQAKFQSTYGLALYENCIRYQNIEKTPWFEISQFRKLMGVEEGKYKVFRDFKNRVIDKAVEEVNKYAAISVTPQYRKQGRKVISIQFVIKSAKETTVRHTDKPVQQATLSEILKLSFGLSKKQVEEVMSSYDRDYILEKITIIETSSNFVNGKINNLAKYLICALKDDYQPTKSGRNRLQIVHDDKAEKEKQKKLEQNRVEAYRRYQNKEMIKLFCRQSKAKQRAFLKQFEENLGKSIYRDIYIRDGLDNILILDQLCLYIRLNNTALLNAIPSYEAFCEIEGEIA